MPYDHFRHAAVSLEQHIAFGEQPHCPIATPVKAKMFVPTHTSTPASGQPGRLPWELQKTNAVRYPMPTIIGFDEEELSLGTSPESEPRPASVPLVKRSLFRSEIPTRPKTAEPVIIRKAGNQPGSLSVAQTKYEADSGKDTAMCETNSIVAQSNQGPSRRLVEWIIITLMTCK
ncbi:Protein CBG08360 [Caenorhabditis briggsae]|uniref:Protein CBG08360 n=1 Tax=Caenorhabditis briggsae TaxID=6238 RepID=A8X6D7_CAEBR|nr:Protein CBG08360 [Caenorhabditis briggsae]CAP28198.2 Protein CBG08360 [Caenorhabditis briggsae]